MGDRGAAPLSAAGFMINRAQRLARRGSLDSDGRPPMPRTLQDTLSHLPTEVLRDLARAHRIDRGRQAERPFLIETLLSLPDPDAVVVEADRRRMEYRLGRLRPRQLRDLGERHRVSLHGLKKKWDLVEALASAPDASEILMELEAQAPAERDAGLILGRDSSLDFDRVEDLLVQARKRFQERRFEAALTAAQEASRIAERTTEQLRRASWSYAILAAQGLLEPCDPADPEAATARGLLERAREALFHGASIDDVVLRDLVRASEGAHSREAERVRDHLALTRDAIREAANLGASIALAEDAWKRGADFLDRGLREGESSALTPAEVGTLLRQAQDVLTKGDYLGGLTFARNAEEATRRLEAQIDDERRHRGTPKPRSGICSVCRSRRVTFQDDGWGRCSDCGNAFRWRGAFGLRQRLRGLLR